MSVAPLPPWVDEAAALRRTARPLPAQLACVVLVGPTCVGKSTLSRAVRRSAAVRDGHVCVPLRYVTRPRRDDDALDENRHVSASEFEALVARGGVETPWARRLDGDRVVRYGFAPATAGRFPVFSGNNALLGSGSPLLGDALIVAVFAPDEVRMERLRRRSPELLAQQPAEAAHRLAECATDAVAQAHVVVANHGAAEPGALAEIVRLVEFAAGISAAGARS